MQSFDCSRYRSFLLTASWAPLGIVVGRTVAVAFSLAFGLAAASSLEFLPATAFALLQPLATTVASNLLSAFTEPLVTVAASVHSLAFTMVIDIDNLTIPNSSDFIKPRMRCPLLRITKMAKTQLII